MPNLVSEVSLRLKTYQRCCYCWRVWRFSSHVDILCKVFHWHMCSSSSFWEFLRRCQAKSSQNKDVLNPVWNHKKTGWQQQRCHWCHWSSHHWGPQEVLGVPVTPVELFRRRYWPETGRITSLCHLWSCSPTPWLAMSMLLGRTLCRLKHIVLRLDDFVRLTKVQGRLFMSHLSIYCKHFCFGLERAFSTQCTSTYCLGPFCVCILYCIMLYCIVFYCITLYCIVFYCIVFYFIVLYCTMFCLFMLYFGVLQFIVFYCILFYCIELIVSVSKLHHATFNYVVY